VHQQESTCPGADPPGSARRSKRSMASTPVTANRPVRQDAWGGSHPARRWWIGWPPPPDRLSEPLVPDLRLPIRRLPRRDRVLPGDQLARVARKDKGAADGSKTGGTLRIDRGGVMAQPAARWRASWPVRWLPVASIKGGGRCRVGDTITLPLANPAPTRCRPMPEAKPMVFSAGCFHRRGFQYPICAKHSTSCSSPIGAEV